MVSRPILEDEVSYGHLINCIPLDVHELVCFSHFLLYLFLHEFLLVEVFLLRLILLLHLLQPLGVDVIEVRQVNELGLGIKRQFFVILPLGLVLGFLLLLVLINMLSIQQLYDVVKVFHSKTKTSLDYPSISFSSQSDHSSSQELHLLRCMCFLILSTSHVGIREVRHVVELKKSRVYGVPQEGRRRAVHKHCTQVTLTFSTQAALVSRCVGLVLGPHIIDLVEGYFLVDCCDGALDGFPKSGIAGVGLVLMVVGEKPSITGSTVIETCGKFMPEIASEGTFQSLVFEEILLKRRESRWGQNLLGVRDHF